MTDIPGYSDFVKIEQITEGMSSDRKFYIETAKNEHLLLRIADISSYEQKRDEFEVLTRATEIGVYASQPIAFGICEDEKCVYQLLSWIDGQTLESLLPKLSKEEQYSMGIQSGINLNKVHQLSAPANTENWSERYFTTIDPRLDAFRNEGVPFDGNEIMLDFLASNRHLLLNRPQNRQHGDYNESNLIVSDSGTLYVIDWNFVDFEGYGDPWYDFNTADSRFPAFVSGQINGYFDNNPPHDFWKLFAYYKAVAAITSIVWAKYFAPNELDRLLQLNADTLVMFNNFKQLEPVWYIKP